jgi:putative tryptophan/tyrosine transport system substrate-binding protein
VRQFSIGDCRLRIGGIATLIVALALTVTTVPLAVEAQQATKVSRIGILTLSTASWAPYAEGFRQGLRDLGWVGGKNIVIEHRDAAGRTDRLPALAGELVGLKVDVIVTQSNVAALAATHATQTIPIVMAIAGDPVKAGLVGSLARPGGNVTGLTLMQTELSGKRLELLKEVAPNIALVAVIWNPTDPPAADMLRETEAAAQTLGLTLHAIEARSSAELDSAFKAVAAVRPDAFFPLPGSLFLNDMTRIIEFASKRGLPGVFPTREFAVTGGLLSYAPSLGAHWRRAAVFVDRILRGARPAEIPIEQPTKFELVVNLTTAKVLGVTIPQSVLIRTDEVIR